MRLLGDGLLVDSNINVRNVPELEQVHSVLLHCNVVHNDYLQYSKLLYTFVPNNAFGQLISVEPKSLIQSKATDSNYDGNGTRIHNHLIRKRTLNHLAKLAK